MNVLTTLTFSDSDNLYDEVDQNTSQGTANHSVITEDNPALLRATATTDSSISTPVTIIPSSAQVMTTFSSSSGTSLPLASIINNKSIGQPQSSVIHIKGLAVVGTGLTDKYIRLQRVCMIHADILVGTSV